MKDRTVCSGAQYVITLNLTGFCVDETAVPALSSYHNPPAYFVTGGKITRITMRSGYAKECV